MTADEAYRGLQVVFNRVFGRSDVALTARLTAQDVPGWDSFRHVDLIMGAEEHFHINLRDADIDEIEDIGDLVAVILQVANAAS
jgi:acyl carrier protein